ncbi:glycosyltransferase family 4 protein [Zunongwangia sp. F363]|uniref:Glycosyltransferase family 4 protein n=1 Tax=Autumnicola tepida TaxID=3075595 RepID=A0ABU3CE48_9FLAO|nr:glycosyltransferase family 4 protein [Zunongwangia sp. F363]MDT0644581.1 glycosyltransferase family 4 protein [Zunongwangia sp. F363]
MPSDLNFFISDASRSSIMGKNLNLNRDVVIPNGTSTDKFYPIFEKDRLRMKLGYDVGKMIIGYVGTIDYHKKMPLLIEAFADLLKENLEAQLVILGDGPALSDLVTEVAELGIEKDVILKGWVAHEQINEHLNCFDIAVHHYASEYMNPLKIYEYLAAGLPVIAPDISSIRENFDVEKDLLTVKSSRVDLYKKLKLLVTNGALRNRLSANERLKSLLENTYTWENYSRGIVGQIIKKQNILPVG